MSEWKVIIEGLWILTWVLRRLFVSRKKRNVLTYIDEQTMKSYFVGIFQIDVGMEGDN